MKKMTLFRIILILLLSIPVKAALGLPFEYAIFDRKKGLEQSFIYAIAQDRDNFLWIGAFDGLYRWDGFSFKKYTRQDGLAEDIVVCSFVDRRGVLYFGHIQGGITVMENETARTLHLPSPAIPQPVAFMEANDRVFILSRNHGIFVAGRDSVEGYLRDAFENRVCKGMAIMNDRLFICHNEGVSYIDLQNLFSGANAVSNIPELEGVVVSAVSPQLHGKGLWIASEDQGVFKLDSRMALSLALPPPDGRIELFYEDANENIWIGLKNKGIVNYLDKGGELALQNAIHTGTGFPTSQISCMIQDHENNYWVGSFDQGLIYLKSAPLETFHFGDFEFNEINAAIPWNDNGFLVGANCGFFYLSYDPRHNEWKAAREKWMEAYKKTITAIHSGRKGLYFGAIEDGVYVVNGDGAVREISMNSALKNMRIRKIVEDSLGNVWISASGAGVFRINEEKKEIENYSTASGLLHNEIYDLFVDNDNRLWIGMHSNGLSALGPGNEFFHLTKSGYLAARDINAIREDKAGNIWIATDGQGLFKYNKKFQLIKNYTVADNLLSDYCAFIVPGDDHMWVGYYNGVDRISLDDGLVERYYATNANDFAPLANAAAINPCGAILIPSIDGFHIVNRNFKKAAAAKRRLILTGLKVNDEERPFSGLVNRKRKLALSSTENRLIFEFMSVSFDPDNKILYSYRLHEGGEAAWSPPSDSRMVPFPSLPPGDYMFEVKSFLKDNPQDFELLSVQFRIRPPVYQQAWFIGLSLAAILAVSFFFHRRRTIMIIRQKNKLEKLVELRTREIIMQKEEIERKNQALKTAQKEIVKKNRQLTGLNGRLESLVEERTEKLKRALKELEVFLYHASHDLKGPLARIKGLSMLARMESHRGNFHALEMMNYESQRLDFVLDKLAKIHSVITMAPSPKMINVVNLVGQAMQTFAGWDEFNRIDWRFHIDRDLTIHSDEDLLKIILENLIENAIIFHHNDPSRNKIVKVSAQAVDSRVDISVYDNGMGIPKEIHSRIFDMYFRGSLCSRGNGLGLYLAQKAAERTGAKISFTTSPGEFTQFQLSVPN